MAGGSDESIRAIDDYGRQLGLAFQIVDDILDVEGEAQDLGKTAGKDARAGKPTYPSIYGLDASRRLAAERHDSAIAALRIGWPPQQPPCRHRFLGHHAQPLKVRLDSLLVGRGLAQSRERATALILSGVVLVNGQPAQKAGTAGAGRRRRRAEGSRTIRMSAGAASSSRTRSTRSASRSTDARRSTSAPPRADSPTCCSGAARRAWLPSTSDTASSTGAFATIRALSSSSARTRDRSSRLTCRRSSTSSPIDVSFISLRHIFPRMPPLLRDGADVVALVKPQFEAGRARGRQEGRRPRPDVQARVVDEATRAAAEVGLVRAAMTESPITGDTGNREFFLHLRSRALMRRVGIVAKARLERAASHLAQIASWLRARNITAGFRSRHGGAGQVGGRRRTRSSRSIATNCPRHVDMIVVLGGDGTLLGTAGRIAQAELGHPDPRRQLRQPRISHRGDAARNLTRRSKQPSTARRKSKSA